MEDDTDYESEEEATPLAPRGQTVYDSLALQDLSLITHEDLDPLQHIALEEIPHQQIQQKAVELLKFERLVCTRYVDCQKKTDCCECGRPRLKHVSQALESKEVGAWNKVRDTAKIPTNAYGTVAFYPDMDIKWNDAQYVRLAHDEDVAKVFKFMVSIWKLDEPKFLLSVVGASKGYGGPKNIGPVLKRGLLKVAEMTNGWVITGGTETGIRSIIGELSREVATIKAFEGNASSTIPKFPFQCIGITGWGLVKNRDKLINNGGTVEYTYEDLQERYHPYIDRNHNFFFLVDDGRVGQFDGEIEFRGKLEAYITSKKIPCVQLMIGGGSGTVNSVFQALNKDRGVQIPVVVFAGSGRAANMLASLCTWWMQCRNTELANKADYLEQEILEQARKEIYPSHIYPERRRLTITKDSLMVKQVKKCITDYLDIITIFDMNSGHHRFDEVVLEAILKGEALSTKDKLKQTQLWNNAHVATTEVLDKQPRKDKLTNKDLEEELERALHGGKQDFVRVLLEYGVNIDEFLTEERLSDLYGRHNSRFANKVEKEVTFGKKKKQSILPQVRFYIESLVEICGAIQKHDVEMQTKHHKPVFRNASFELFCWSILCGNVNLAKLFWARGDFILSKAVIGHCLLSYMALKANREYAADEVAKNLESHAKVFEGLSICFLDEVMQGGKVLFSLEKPRVFESASMSFLDERCSVAQHLVTREIPFWDGKNCMQIAAMADNKRFMAHTACQNQLDKTWTGELCIQPLLEFKVLLCCLFAPFAGLPVILLLNYRQSYEKVPIDTKLGVGPEVPVAKAYGWYQKVWYFWRAPITKFWMNVICYLVFLTMFADVVCRKLERMPSSREYYVIIMAFSYFLEELRQILQDYEGSLVAKLRKWYLNYWNLCDVAAIFLFALALGFRTNSTTLLVGHFLYGLDLMIWILRLLDTFSVNKNLGPYVVMLGLMLVDLFVFIFIFAIFLLAYCFARFAVLYPETLSPEKYIYDILFVPVMEIFGEYFLQYPEKDSLTTLYGSPYIKGGATWIATVLLVGYLIITQILLLNIIIAKFNNTFEKIMAESDTVWKFQRYFIVCEYARRPMLPPPLSIISIVFFALQYAYRSCRRHGATRLSRGPEPYGAYELRVFESNCYHSLLSKENYTKQFITECQSQPVCERLSVTEENTRPLALSTNRSSKYSPSSCSPATVSDH